LVLQPGERGTRRLLAEYGQRLVCVRYRYDERLKRRWKTAELIVSESHWAPREPRPGTRVRIRIRYEETDLRRRIKEAGGIWDAGRKAWRLRYDRALELGLKDRIEARPVI
jgi:hypothetical protein